MIITNEFYFRGWLPAGLVINSRLLSNQPIGDDTAVLTPIINPSPGTSWPVDQPRPIFPVAQATDVRAIVLKDPIPETTLVMLPLGDWYGDGTPYILAVNTWYDGKIQEISGDDVPSVRILLKDVHPYSSKGILNPATDTCIGEMPACILAGARANSGLFLDPESSVVGSGVLGWSARVSIDSNSTQAYYMRYLTIKPVHTAGMSMALKVENPQEERSMESYLRCSLVTGKAPALESAGDILYYGIVPVPRMEVQPIFFVDMYQISAPAFIDSHNLLFPEAGMMSANMSLAIVDVSGDGQIVQYNS